jgi:hypothetical protein
LMGLSNRALNEILGARPHIHCKKVDLVELILERDYS